MITEKHKEQMRVKIAKDVLLQLKIKHIIPKGGTYIGELHAIVGRGVDGQTVLTAKKVKPCEACALGAGFISLVRLEDNWRGGDYPGLHERLGKYFTQEQLAALEQVFENWVSPRLALGDKEEQMKFVWSFVVKKKGKFTRRQLLKAAFEKSLPKIKAAAKKQAIKLGRVRADHHVFGVKDGTKDDVKYFWDGTSFVTD